MKSLTIAFSSAYIIPILLTFSKSQLAVVGRFSDYSTNSGKYMECELSLQWLKKIVHGVPKSFPLLNENNSGNI